MLSNPVFIIGTERSGSNLLRLLLNEHSRIAIPHPPHIMRDMAPLADLYGDLSRETNMRQLVEDVVAVANDHFAPWPFKLNKEKILERVESRSLYGVYCALQDLYLQNAGKARWGCKSTFMYQQIDEILRHHEEPRFIHLVRDPRDVAVSAGKSIFSRYHPYKQGELWTEQQGAIERKASDLGERRLLRVRYEDLTTDVESEMRRIMKFLGEEFEPAQLRYFLGADAGRLSSLSESWKNCGEPVSNKSVGRYRRELSRSDIAWVEFHAAELMGLYGYRVDSDGPVSAPSALEKLRIEGTERWRMLETEARALLKDRNFVMRWRKWLKIQRLRRTRSNVHG